jgi:hypothetical protein
MKSITCSLIVAAMVLMLVASNGCKTYMHFKYGLTQPKEETPAKLVSFLEKHHFQTENLYMFSDSLSYCQAIRNPVFIKNMLGHMIFDHEGNLLQRDTTQCQWSGYDKIKSLSNDSTYEKCNGPGLDQILAHIQPFGENTTHVNVLTNSDFTVIVTWAKFMGSYNSRLFVLSDAVKLNTTAKIRLIWLNVDMQESWKLKSEQKVAIK